MDDEVLVLSPQLSSPVEKKETSVPGTTGDQLREQLRRQAQAAADETIRAGGQVPPEQIEALANLARLAELHQAAQQPQRRRRWPVAVLLGTTLLLISLLFFARVRETEVELDLVLSEVSFVSPTQQVLAGAMNLSSLGASGLREIQLPRAGNREAQTIQGDEGAESAVRLSAVSDGKRQGNVTLATLVVPPATQVWVRHTAGPHQYRLSLKGSPLKLRADVNGPVQVAHAASGLEQLDFATPNAVNLHPGTDEVDLDLTFPDSAKGVFSPQLTANQLYLFHVDDFPDAQHTVARKLSSIVAGNIYFVSLNDRERKLRPGEMLHLDQAKGEFRTLSLQNDHIEIRFHGRVRGMSVGPDDDRRSLMPTWLEWLQARHSLSLLWGTALYVFGLIVVALRWWGKVI